MENDDNNHHHTNSKKNDNYSNKNNGDICMYNHAVIELYACVYTYVYIYIYIHVCNIMYTDAYDTSIISSDLSYLS